MREKHFLCACEERGFRRTKGREQSERWREKKWISTISIIDYSTTPSGYNSAFYIVILLYKRRYYARTE
jgi:hypothetical protein